MKQRLSLLVIRALVLGPLVVVLVFPPSVLRRYNRLDMAFVILLAWLAFWTVRAMRHWKKYERADKERYFKRLILCCSVFGFFLLLMAVDPVLQRHYSTSGLMVLGNNAKGYELHTLNLYPYTAFHPRADCHVKGPMPLEANPVYQEFDVRSGDHGFFVDFDLDEPPPKEKNEFRIVLIGGSAAQGYGGQTNEHMFYRLLEKKLQKEVFGSSGRVRIINLALANSISYQNFIALNKWGHALEPDLILSFSGVNDVRVPLLTHSDMPFRFQGVMGLTRSTWETESPKLVEDFAAYYPALNKSLLGVAIRVLNSTEVGEKAADEYRLSHRPAHPPTFYHYPLRLYVHAFKSIKRDFQGIPIVIAFQPHYLVLPFHQHALDHLMNHAPQELKGYVNDDWFFLNMQAHFQKESLLNDQTMLAGMHLLNRGHEAATDFLAQELTPILRKLRSMP